jgi:hypothetical protein
MHRHFKVVLMGTLLFVMCTPLLADTEKATIESLERQIEALKARISALEQRDIFTSFMPDYAERFHVMHHAGDAGDWAVASHQLLEMKRLTRLSTSIDADKGKLMQSMMNPKLEDLEHAIEHGNQKKFQKALVDTTNTCNACHTATGSPFIQVTLDVSESLSIRHPHKLTPQAVPGGHTH